MNLAPHTIQCFRFPSVCSQMFGGRFALFGTHDMRTVNTVRSYTNKFHMPYVTSSMPVNVTGQNNGYILYMRPLYTQAIIDIIRHYHWTRIFYVFDKEDGKCHKRQRGTIVYRAFDWRIHIWYSKSPSPGLNGRHFANDVSKCIFVNEKYFI